MAAELHLFGHDVTIVSATKLNINVSARILTEEGYTIENLQEQIQNSIEEYFKELKSNWENTTSLIVRIAHIESRILNVIGIKDIFDTKINNDVENIVVSNEEIPFLSGCDFTDSGKVV